MAKIEKPRTLADLIHNWCGVKTYSVINPVNAALGAAILPILTQNPNRVWFIIMNLSANAEYVLPAPNPAAALGIQLGVNGGAITMDYLTDLELVGMAWYGVAPAGASAILVMEQLIAH